MRSMSYSPAILRMKKTSAGIFNEDIGRALICRADGGEFDISGYFLEPSAPSPDLTVLLDPVEFVRLFMLW